MVNYLVLALELATMIKHVGLLKRLVCSLYNHLLPFFAMALRTPLAFQSLVKCHEALRLIPNEQFDGSVRRAAACISYELVCLCMQNDEEPLARRALLSELSLAQRKWRTFSSSFTVHPQLSEEDQAKKAE